MNNVDLISILYVQEQVRAALEKKLHATVKQITEEKDCELSRLQANLCQLQSHIDKICQQHEDALLRAEGDKQQALLIAQQDQKAIQDRLSQVLKELEEEKCTLDRIKRESAGRSEQVNTTQVIAYLHPWQLATYTVVGNTNSSYTVSKMISQPSKLGRQAGACLESTTLTKHFRLVNYCCPYVTFCG